MCTHMYKFARPALSFYPFSTGYPPFPTPYQSLTSPLSVFLPPYLSIYLSLSLSPQYLCPPAYLLQTTMWWERIGATPQYLRSDAARVYNGPCGFYSPEYSRNPQCGNIIDYGVMATPAISQGQYPRRYLMRKVIQMVIDRKLWSEFLQVGRARFPCRLGLRAHSTPHTWGKGLRRAHLRPYNLHPTPCTLQDAPLFSSSSSAPSGYALSMQSDSTAKHATYISPFINREIR
jgi:hypothetical protein